MVLEDLIHNLSNMLGLNKEDKFSKNRVHNLSSIDFPQGSQLLNYRQDKNLRGLRYMPMTNVPRNKNNTQDYVKNIKKEKTNFNKIINQGMNKNLEIIEGFNNKSCVDRDFEYYKNLSDKMRNKRMINEKIHYCLTGIDTHIAESDSININNLSYNSHLKSISNNAKPWELIDMYEKILPDNLHRINILSEKEKSCLSN
mgnify:FL=1